MLLGDFAVVALRLAGIGIYGMISYGGSERRFEIGVRMALCADRSAVLASVLGDGVPMAVVASLEPARRATAISASEALRGGRWFRGR